MGKPQKLEGRKNYDSWRVEAKAYLSVKGFWKCFDGTETDADKNFLAIQTLNLLLAAPLYTYTENCTMAKEAWETIEKAFTDAGIGRRGDMLRQLVSLKRSDCESMESYVHAMMLLATKIKKAGLEIGDEVVAHLMLTGLPEDYRPMTMAIENSTAKLSTDFVQNRLLQEVSNNDISTGTDTTALVARGGKKANKKKKSKSIVCYICDEPGHISKNCPKKKSKSDRSFFASFVAKTDSANE